MERPIGTSADGTGGTTKKTIGPPELRVEIIPVLGSFLGGNYAYLVWDEADPERRALVVDPSGAPRAQKYC